MEQIASCLDFVLKILLFSDDFVELSKDEVTIGVYDFNLKLVDIGQFYRTAIDIQSSDGACMIRVDPLHWDHFDENGNEVII